jgi:hypothetical protein
MYGKYLATTKIPLAKHHAACSSSTLTGIILLTCAAKFALHLLPLSSLPLLQSMLCSDQILNAKMGPTRSRNDEWVQGSQIGPTDRQETHASVLVAVIYMFFAPLPSLGDQIQRLPAERMEWMSYTETWSRTPNLCALACAFHGVHGVYWKPVWNVLEFQFAIILANAQHIKNVPGRKTDQNDTERLRICCSMDD